MKKNIIFLLSVFLLAPSLGRPVDLRGRSCITITRSNGKTYTIHRKSGPAWKNKHKSIKVSDLRKKQKSKDTKNKRAQVSSSLTLSDRLNALFFLLLLLGQKVAGVYVVSDVSSNNLNDIKNGTSKFCKLRLGDQNTKGLLLLPFEKKPSCLSNFKRPLYYIFATKYINHCFAEPQFDCFNTVLDRSYIDFKVIKDSISIMSKNDRVAKHASLSRALVAYTPKKGKKINKARVARLALRILQQSAQYLASEYIKLKATTQVSQQLGSKVSGFTGLIIDVPGDGLFDTLTGDALNNIIFWVPQNVLDVLYDKTGNIVVHAMGTLTSMFSEAFDLVVSPYIMCRITRSANCHFQRPTLAMVFGRAAFKIGESGVEFVVDSFNRGYNIASNLLMGSKEDKGAQKK